MARAAALALVLFALLAGDAHAAQELPVYVVDGPLPSTEGASGLLVPGAGPETSREQALAALVQGEVRNSLRGDLAEEAASDQRRRARRSARAAVHPRRPAEGRNAAERQALSGRRRRAGLPTGSSSRTRRASPASSRSPTSLRPRSARSGALGSQPDSDPAATLAALDARIDDHNDSRVPAGLLAGLILIALALLWPKAGLLGFGAALLANLALGLAEVSSFWPTLVVIGLAAAAGGPLLALALRSDLAVGLFLAGIVAAYLVALGVDGSAVALSSFGPSQNSRFYGLSNFLETMLLVPALGGAVLLWRRLGWSAFAGVALLSFVTVAGNRFGADGGGAIVLAVAFPLLAILLARLRGRRLAVAIGTAIAVAAGLLVLDAVTGPESHVSRALDSGPSGIAADLRDRVELSWDRIAHQADIAAVVAVCLPVLVILVVRLLRSDAPLERRALPLAYAAALATSLVVNDSPNDVLTAGLVGYVVVEAVMLRDRCAVLSPSPGSSPGSPSSLPAAAPPRS